MMRTYFETIRSLMGQQYMTVIVLLVFAIWTWLILSNRKKIAGPYLLVLALIVALALPVYYLYLRVLHVPMGTYAVAFQVLPGIPLAAYGLTALGEGGAAHMGKRIWWILVAVVLLIASQPWTYTLQRFRPTAITAAKVDAEVVEVAQMMDGGIAFMPTEIAPQFGEVQSHTGVCYGVGYDLTATDTPSAMVDAILTYQMDYMVCPRESDNPEWFGGYGYQPVGETEHYIVYACQKTKQ